MWSILTGCLTLTLTLTLTPTLTLTLTLTLTPPALRYPAQIKRFADHLYKAGELEKYMQLLVDNFNPATIPETMCRPHPHPNSYTSCPALTLTLTLTLALTLSARRVAGGARVLAPACEGLVRPRPLYPYLYP